MKIELKFEKISQSFKMTAAYLTVQWKLIKYLQKSFCRDLTSNIKDNFVIAEVVVRYCWIHALQNALTTKTKLGQHNENET